MEHHRIHIDSRADHNTLMEQLCRQAAAGLARQIDLTSDPIRREVLRRRMREHQLQSEQHRRTAEELRQQKPCLRGANFAVHS